MFLLDSNQLCQGIGLQRQCDGICHRRLKQHAHRIDLFYLLRFQVAHRGAFVTLAVNKPGLLEGQQRLSHRRSVRTEPQHEIGLHKAFAGVQPAKDNVITQCVEDFLPRR